MKRLTRRQEIDRAIRLGDWERMDQVSGWAVGGYRKRHAPLRRARRKSENRGHRLRPFRSGAQILGPEKGDPDLYSAECRRCGRVAYVSFDDSREPQIRGTAIDKECDK